MRIHRQPQEALRGTIRSAIETSGGDFSSTKVHASGERYLMLTCSSNTVANPPDLAGGGGEGYNRDECDQAMQESLALHISPV